MISLIVAINNTYSIGKDNKMLWKNSEDLKEFKRITSGNIVIMGAKTFDSLNLPKGLPDRINIVISTKRSQEMYLEDSEVYFVGSIQESIELAEMFSKYFSYEIFVIGGEAIYKAFIDHVDKLYISMIDNDLEGDKKFPMLEYMAKDWEVSKIDIFETFSRVTYTKKS